MTVPSEVLSTGPEEIDVRNAMRLLWVVALVSMAAACSNITVVHDYDREVDFSSFQTWAWISDDNLIGQQAGVVEMSYVSPLDEQRIRRTVEADLLAKGYRKVARDDADLIVSFTVGTEEKTRIYSTPNAGFYDDYYGYGYGGWYGGSTVRTQQYTEGTLSLQFFERASKNAVWVGWGSKTVSKSDDSEKVIRQAVEKILEKFPARS